MVDRGGRLLSLLLLDQEAVATCQQASVAVDIGDAVERGAGYAEPRRLRGFLAGEPPRRRRVSAWCRHDEGDLAGTVAAVVLVRCAVVDVTEVGRGGGDRRRIRIGWQVPPSLLKAGECGTSC